MKLLILGGISPHNQPWVHDVAQAFTRLVTNTVVHEYAHWQHANGAEMDVDGELAVVSQKAANLGEYAVFAKSAGSIVTLKGIAEGKLSPKACIFTGLPLKLILREFPDAPSWISANQAPVVLFQNTNDPAGSYADVKAFLAQTGAQWQLVELPGDTHSYDDLATITQQAAAYLAR